MIVPLLLMAAAGLVAVLFADGRERHQRRKVQMVVVLFDARFPLRAATLSDQLGISSAATYHLLGTLARDGLVERVGTRGARMWKLRPQVRADLAARFRAAGWSG